MGELLMASVWSSSRLVGVPDTHTLALFFWLPCLCCLYRQMSQPKRLGALNKFKAGERTILIATDVASRGLDIPSVDLVVNYDIPGHGKGDLNWMKAFVV